ncbi:hypothetical protein [Actinomadura macrotermitis]|uniref:DUF3558 domain-containing protein n=1 Tax=Actinomadura macrotermitis TaxID=2585200 RepID=A0A7K0C0T4_9ACTN|nr:hypothetical protein [Actinomadura macrotermitis]MQY06682.1 hypothetical protein [Actinomadura macrotermitis]
MGLPRPSEPFQRVYSAPEPPSPARRPRLLAWIVGLAAFALAAGTVFLLAPGGDEGRTVARSTPPSSAPRASAPPTSAPPSTTRPSPAPTTAAPVRPLAALPPVCGAPSPATVRTLVPSARRDQGANEILTTCTYTATRGPFRWLRVEARLSAPSNSAAPVEDARRFFASQWAQARDNDLARVLTLERTSGLGDEAFRLFKVDKGQPTAVGEVTMRLRNAVVTVGYSEMVPAKGDAAGRERACLAKAAQVAREVMKTYR